MDIPLDLKLFMNNAASKVYKCDQCNASYSDKAYFEMHKQSHQKEVLQIVMTSGAGSSSGHPAPAHQQQVIHLQDQNQQLRAFKQAYGSDAQVYQVVDGSYQVGRSTASSSSSTTLSHNTMNHQAQVNVPTYTAPTYIMTEVPVQHNRIQTQQPSHHHQQQQQQQQHQVQQQVQLQQQVQVQPQVQQHVTQHSGPGNPRSLQSQDTKERPYKCDQCTASFIDPAELAEHTKKHSGDGPFTCEDCHFTFMYKSHFRSHKTRCSKKTRTSTRVVNPKPVQRNFPTNQNNQQGSGQASNSNQNQNQQYVQPAPAKAPTPKKPKRTQEFNPSQPTFKRTKKETIKADRPFECNECDASFQSLQDLQNHKTKHTGEGPFKCEECRFVFLYRKLYEAHRRRCEKKRKETTRGTVSRPAPVPQPTHQTTTHHAPEPQHHVQQHHQQIQQVQHQVSHHQQQQVTQRPTTVSTVAQVHNIPQHQPAVIDMRAVQSQLQHQQVQQQVQHLQHPQLIEQVIHVTPSGTIAGGRQDFAAVDMDSMNQIMNLIKVKGHH